MKKNTGVLLSLLCLLLLVSTLTGQTILHVSKQGPFHRIQDAIDMARDGYVILVGPGRYVENVNYKYKDIMVVSRSGPEATIIDGNEKGMTVRMAGGVLAGFTVTRGSQSGVFVEGPGTVINNIIVNNKASSGGGISSYDQPLVPEAVIAGAMAGETCAFVLGPEELGRADMASLREWLADFAIDRTGALAPRHRRDYRVFVNPLCAPGSGSDGPETGVRPDRRASSLRATVEATRPRNATLPKR